jgi:hypothetical protein
LTLQVCARPAEGGLELLEHLRHEPVRLGDRLARIVDELRLQRVPAVAELLRALLVEERIEPGRFLQLGLLAQRTASFVSMSSSNSAR